jgi:hypothetical protein
MDAGGRKKEAGMWDAGGLASRILPPASGLETIFVFVI